MADTKVVALILTPDNPCNTTVTSSATGETVYTVATAHDRKRSVTSVCNADGGQIASWEWREVQSDILTLGDAKPVSMSAWLSKSLIPFKNAVTFQGPNRIKYKWKNHAPGLELELYAPNLPNPIAQFKKTRTATPARLLLDEHAQAIQDLVVISFLALEKGRRATEVSTINRADALAIPPMGGGP